MVVLLAPHLDKPLARVPLLAHQLHLGRTPNLVRGALADAGAGVLAGSAAVAHQVNSDDFRAFGVLAAWVLGLRTPRLDEHVALTDGVFHHRSHGLVPRVVRAQHEVGTDSRETERGDGLHEGSDVAG